MRDTLKGAAIAVALLSLGAAGSIAPAVIRSQPTGGGTGGAANYTITTTAAPAIIAGSYSRIGWLVQGASGAGNSGCASWFPQASLPLSISGATCVNGFPIFPGSREIKSLADGAMPTTPLTVIGASGSSLIVTSEVQ